MREDSFSFRPSKASFYCAMPIAIVELVLFSIIFAMCIGQWISQKDYFPIILIVVFVITGVLLIACSVIAYNMNVKVSATELEITHPMLKRNDSFSWSSVSFGYYTNVGTQLYLILSGEGLDRNAIKHLARKRSFSLIPWNYRVGNCIVLYVGNVYDKRRTKIEAVTQGAIQLKECF